MSAQVLEGGVPGSSLFGAREIRVPWQQPADQARKGCGLRAAAFVGDGTKPTYSLHCSSLFWFNQFYIKNPNR